MTVGTMLAFAAYLRMLYGPLASLMNSRVEVVTAIVSFERVFEVIDLPVDVQMDLSLFLPLSFRSLSRFFQFLCFFLSSLSILG